MKLADRLESGKQGAYGEYPFATHAAVTFLESMPPACRWSNGCSAPERSVLVGLLKGDRAREEMTDHWNLSLVCL